MAAVPGDGPDGPGAIRELLWRVTRLEKQNEELDSRIDRLIMAAVVAAFSLAGAIVLLGLNLLLMQGGR